MSITVEYKGREFEFDEIPTDEELEQRYWEEVSQQWEGASNESENDTIESVEYGDEAPLPSGGRRMWYLQQAARDSGAFNLIIPIEIDGTLDREALRRACKRLTERHEILRAEFPIRGGEPVQRTEPTNAEFAWRFRDVSEAEDSVERAERLMEGWHAEPFDLTEESAVRFNLIRVAEQRHIFAFVCQHIAIDKWCGMTLLAEFAHLYESYRDGEESQLGDVPLQYGDYAVWQRQRLETEAFEEGIEFWQDYLDGATEYVEWPVDGGSSGHTRPSGIVEFEWSERLSQRLREWGESLSVRSEIVYLSTLFGAFLGGYATQRDVTVGLEMTTEERRRKENRRTMGYMNNVIPLRVEADPGRSASAVLSEVWDRWGTILNFQWIPLEEIVDAVGAARRPDRRPLFDTVFTYTPTDIDPNRPLEPIDMALYEFGLKPPQARSVIELEMWGRGDTFNGHFIYDKSKFDEVAVASMTESFEKFVEVCVRQPEVPLEAHDIFDGDFGRDQSEAPAPKRQVGSEQTDPPESRIESAIVDLWRELLEIESVGRRDGFFEVGGDSLTAVRLRRQLEEAFSVDLEVLEMLEQPTVEGLAQLVEERQNGP